LHQNKGLEKGFTDFSSTHPLQPFALFPPRWKHRSSIAFISRKHEQGNMGGKHLEFWEQFMVEKDAQRFTPDTLCRCVRVKTQA